MKKSLGQIFMLVFALWLVLLGVSSFAPIFGKVALFLFPAGLFILVLIHAKRCSRRGGSILAVAMVILSFLALLPVFALAAVNFMPAEQQSSQQLTKKQKKQLNQQLNQQQLNNQLNQEEASSELSLEALPVDIADSNQLSSVLETVFKVIQIYLIILILALATHAAGLLLWPGPAFGAGKTATSLATVSLALTTLLIIFSILQPALPAGKLVPAFIVVTGVLFAFVGFYRLGKGDGTFSKVILDDSPAKNAKEDKASAEEPMVSDKKEPAQKPAQEPSGEPAQKTAPLKPPSYESADQKPAPLKPPSYESADQKDEVAGLPVFAPGELDPGWYKDGNTLRYWDGSAWVAEQPAADE